jgi:acetate kinase
MRIVALNVGSSSIKWASYDGCSGPEPWAETRGALEGGPAALDDAALGRVLAGADRVVHRVVHGGARHAPARVDDALLAELDGLVPLAPLHLPPALAILRRARTVTAAPQLACFDTAFHASLPAVAARMPLPDAVVDLGVRRYGFHGLSYEWVQSTLGSPPPARVVALHLGNGASACAMKDGVSIDTTMGMTPTGGFPMGTRSGDLDPGILLYLMRERGYGLAALERLLERDAGLKGIGGTSDMRELLARRGTDARARLAVDVFVHAIAKTVGGFAAVLGGLDVLVFSGGIGEHAAPVRGEIAAKLAWLPPFETRVVATNEELVLARHAAAL